MNKSNFFQTMTIASVAVLSGATLAIPQKAEAATAYGYSYLDTQTTITTNGFTIDSFGTSTSDSAVVVDTPGGVSGFIDPIDAEQAFVGNNPLAENTFAPKGQVDADYGRGDVLIRDASTNLVDGANLGEAYVSSPISNTPVGDEAQGDGEWEWVSGFFTADVGDSVDFGIDAIYDLAVEITNGDASNAFAQAGFNYEIEINDANGAPVFASEFGRQLGIIEPASESLDETGSPFVLDNGNSFTFDQAGEYDITITSIEEATARINQGKPVPEPTSILGLLAIGSLGLALKRRTQAL